GVTRTDLLAAAQITSVNQALTSYAELSGRDANASQAYRAKKRELGELESFGRILGQKLEAEKIDQALPKTTMVEVLDKAVPAQKKTGGFLGLLPGDYASTARLKVERDATDIEALAGDHAEPIYDPYFIQ